MNLACFGVRGPPKKFFREKIVTCENKSCFAIISEQLCQKTFLSHLLSFRDKGGPNFQRKCTNFGILGPKEAPRRSKNLKNGLGTPDYPCLDPWPSSLFPKRAARSIKVSGPLLPRKSGSLWGSLRLTFTVSHPDKVESRARCLNRGNWTLRVQKRCFWEISTPSSGQN